MQTLNELLLQLGLGLVVALSLYVMGAIQPKLGPRSSIRRFYAVAMLARSDV
jgi:hypothetical protein